MKPIGLIEYQPIKLEARLKLQKDCCSIATWERTSELSRYYPVRRKLRLEWQ